MVVRITCPHCGASNLEDAEWCGQCYQPLKEKPPPSDGPVEVEPSGAEAADLSSDTTSGSMWACALCGERNPLELDVCSVCGTSLFAAYEEPAPEIDPRDALVASVVPGLGMARAGMGGEGLIAGILTAFSVLGGVAIVASGEPLAAVIVVCGLALWAVAARDAFVVARDGRRAAWLQPRTLTIVAVVILLVTALALLRAVPSGNGEAT